AEVPDAVLHPQTSLLCLENTYNAAGGVCLSVEQTKDLADTALFHGLKIHLDGARLFNSAVGQGVSPEDLTREVDSVTICLTKGLGCPVGALVLGEADFMDDARRWRQAVGGGMRQAGVVAATGIVALDTMVDRLAEDHSNARRLAALLTEAGLIVDPLPDEVETNIVFAEIPAALMDAKDFVQGLAAAGVQVNPPGARRIRLLTHHDVSADDIEAVSGIVREVLGP
ncbi:MAG: GntG family PLP-dependent aldolase, partial [bacterium]